MPYQIDTPIPINIEKKATFYLISPKHRGNPTNEISVWLVDTDAELKCFSQCYQYGWFNQSNGWSFISSGARNLIRIGHNLRSPELLIAKFVTNENLWHGYPADIRHKPADKPLPNILNDWLVKGHISKAFMTRIKQGQL